MDFREAFKAHSDWKIKLLKYIKNPDNSLDPTQISVDNKCVLGKWIYGDGTQFNTFKEFEDLRIAHASFHKCAASIVERANEGEEVPKTDLVDPKSEYDKISMEVFKFIISIRNKIDLEEKKALKGSSTD